MIAEMYSVDAVGAGVVVADLDVDASAFAVHARGSEAAMDDAAAALRGSSTVQRALSAFLLERDTTASRVSGRLSSAAGAVIESVTAVVVADEEMVSNVARDQAAADRGPATFSADRFGAGWAGAHPPEAAASTR